MMAVTVLVHLFVKTQAKSMNFEQIGEVAIVWVIGEGH